MFDPFPASSESAQPAFDMERMVAALGRLSDADLARIEDDLDFYHFTGCCSDRLQALLSTARPLRNVA